MDLDTYAASIRETPAPEARFEKGNRAAAALWIGEPNENGHRPALEVSARHFKSSRTYGVVAQPMMVEDTDIGRVSTYDPVMSLIRLTYVKAARYSEKDLRALHTAWVAKVRAGDAGDAVEAALASVLGRDPR